MQMKPDRSIVARLSIPLAISLLASTPVWGVTNFVQSVTPAAAPQGSSGLWVQFTFNTTPPPPATSIAVSSVKLGNLVGTASPRTNQYLLSAHFNIPGNEPTGTKDVVIQFPGSFVGYKAAGFTVTAATNLTAAFSASPTNGSPPLTVNFTDASAGPVTNRLWDFGDGATSTETNPAHTYQTIGSFPVSLTILGPPGSNTLTRTGYINVTAPPTNGAYVIVDTGQTNCYNNTGVIPSPAFGQPFYGQDAQHSGNSAAYTNNGDGTITDLTTGLMWVQARGTQSPWAAAISNAANCRVGGYTDWRAPTIKELYSLVKSTGANGNSLTNATGYIPYIDTNYFGFAYGGTSTTVGSRIIDAQDWSANYYGSTVMGGQAAAFGYNFTDGRIKGYPPANDNYIRYVRGNPGYGRNKFVNNGDGTISDQATRLMWARNDSGTSLSWSNALAWAQAQNAANYLGHNDWRLPNAKELQSIVDYTRSPDITASPALDPVFNCTQITNEAGQADYPFFWASTTLITGPASAEGLYVCFGRAMGYVNNAWVDAHGAGAQRSDLKSGNPADYPTGRGPQGDAVRIYNYARLVRDEPATPAWRFAFVGDTHVPLSTISAEIAAAVLNDDIKLVIVAGDLVESGPATPTNTLHDRLIAWRDAFAPVRASGIGVYAVRGNHEDDAPDNIAIWNSVFSGAYAMPGNGPAGERNLTYSFTHSNACFIGLDDYIQIHRINQPWLNQQLATNRQPHLFTFGHEPAFKAFHTDGLDDYPDERNAFWSSLTAAGARVYLCGHDHFFNVARIDDGDGIATNDLYQFIVGTGGTTNWPPQRYNYNGTNAPYTPANLASVTNTYGYLLVELSGPGSNDLGVKLTWKQRTYDTNTASYLYVATTNTFAYTAINPFTDSVGDGIPDAWRKKYFGGTGITTNADSCASCDADGDGLNNTGEYIADTNPTNALSRFQVERVTRTPDVNVTFSSSARRVYTLYYRTNLNTGGWVNLPSQTDAPGNGGTATLTDPSSVSTQRFYRLSVRVP